MSLALHGLQITAHSCVLIATEATACLIAHLTIKIRLYFTKRDLAVFVASLWTPSSCWNVNSDDVAF